MTVVSDAGNFNDEGQRDARRHHDRVRKQIAEKLRERIGEEKLITAGSDHRVRIPIAGSKEYRFILDRGQGGGAAAGDAGVGDVLDDGSDPGAAGKGGQSGPPGSEPGSEDYEVWLDRDEVAQILFEQLGLPRLRRRHAEKTETVSISFDEIARKGPLIDKKATVRENMFRNAASGKTRIGGISRDDLRYLTFREQTRPKTQAVVFMLLDVSGSMGVFEKRCARLFFWWSVQFLRSRYTDCELVFIAHHTEAKECSEEEFFTRVESGGTRVSSAYELALDLQRRRYPTSEWDVVVLHASDGDNESADNARVVSLIGELSDALLMGYMQIDRGHRYHWSGAHLFGVLAKSAGGNFVTTRVSKDEEIWAALKAIFHPDDQELAS